MVFAAPAALLESGAMDHIGVIPGSGSGKRGGGSDTGSGVRSGGSGGSGDASVGTSRNRRSRLSAQSTGTSLMPAFDDAAGDGDGRATRSSSGRFEDATKGHNRHRKASQDPNLRHPVFGSYPTQDDEVIVMDGVLFDKNWAVSSPRRSPTLSELGFIPSSPLGSGGRSSSSGFDRQFSDGRGEPRLSKPMKRISYEMEPQIGQQGVQGTGFYMPYPLPPPSTSPRGFPLQIGQQVQGIDLYMPRTLTPPPTPSRGFPLQIGQQLQEIGQQLQGSDLYMPRPLTPPPTSPRGFHLQIGQQLQERDNGLYMPRAVTPPPTLQRGFPLLPPSLPFVPDMIPAAQGGFLAPPPSLPLPGVVPPPAGSSPYFTQPRRATRTAVSSRPPPGFNFAPQRRLEAQGPGFYPARSQAPPLPPPRAQKERPEFSWPPKAGVGVVSRPPRPPDSSEPKQPAMKPPESKQPVVKPPPLGLPSPDNTFTWPPTEEEDKIINDVLYGPSNRRRLQVFKSICPD